MLNQVPIGPFVKKITVWDDSGGSFAPNLIWFKNKKKGQIGTIVPRWRYELSEGFI